MGLLAASANAETPPRIDYVEHDETSISGHILNAEKNTVYYARVTLLVEDSIYIILETKISEDGTWSIDFHYSADYIILQIVDKPYMLMPIQYRIYDTIGMPAES